MSTEEDNYDSSLLGGHIVFTRPQHATVMGWIDPVAGSIEQAADHAVAMATGQGDESRVLALVDGLRTVVEILRISPLPNDVTRADETVKEAFETVFKAMIALIGRDVKNAPSRENTAMAISALCIGGMVVARSMNDRHLGDRLREAATKVALELGGWTKPRRERSRT